MQKQIVAVMLIAGVAFSFSGCRKEEQKQLPTGHPGMVGTMPPGGMPKVERAVLIPKDVKEKWKSVKLSIEDKAAKTSKEYIVAVGSGLVVPNTKVAIKVLAFLPQFAMSNQEITSKSNEPLMPAVRVLVQEPGKRDWNGWLFSAMPDMHPFEHEKLRIRLVGGVAK